MVGGRWTTVNGGGGGGWSSSVNDGGGGRGSSTVDACMHRKNADKIIVGPFL